MTDESGDTGKEKEHDSKKKSGGSDEFGLAIARIAVAQICESYGFQGFQQSALESLSHIAIRYLCELGKATHFYANVAGRTDCNVFDIIHGLENLGDVHGFTGASDINRCSTSSGTVREIIQFVNCTEEIPFARTVPQFPVIENRKPTPSFLQMSESPDGEHIPNWLPAFPDRSTYIPCLAPPLQSGELPTSSVINPTRVSNEAIPVKNQTSAMDILTPAIEASKAAKSETGDSDQKILPNKRQVVSFKLGIAKKQKDAL
ncbi:hypothetical protein MKX01_038971 [Papaver californicum]|nr:hypothetical protein MKX01_038971 [Papaver californicum]